MKKQIIISYEKKKMIPYLNSSFQNLKAGDILIVLYRYKYFTSLVPLVRQFVGICLGKRSHYRTSTLIVRNIIDKEGVEFHINAFSNNVLSLKKSKMKKNNYIRNKLFYLRRRIA
jgi:ribosomal protein L19